MIGKKCIVRSNVAGVHAGIVEYKVEGEKRFFFGLSGVHLKPFIQIWVIVRHQIILLIESIMMETTHQVTAAGQHLKNSERIGESNEHNAHDPRSQR